MFQCVLEVCYIFPVHIGLLYKKKKQMKFCREYIYFFYKRQNICVYNICIWYGLHMKILKDTNKIFVQTHIGAQEKEVK